MNSGDKPKKYTKKWKLYAFFIFTISLLAGSIAFLIHYIFIGLNDVSTVQIKIIPPPRDNSNAAIQITNDGKVPATNLNLTIKLPDEVEKQTFTNVTSVHTSWSKFSPTILKAHINKLVHGTGAIVNISIPIKDKQNFNCNAYYIYAVYDEGSTKGYCPTFDVIHQFNILHNSIKMGILVTLTIILSSILFIFIPKYLITFIIRKKRK